jgi:hypothetical protein
MGHLGFAPRVTPEDFRCAFTAARGWGSLSQRREGRTQTCEAAIRWGSLWVRSLSLELPVDAVLEEASVTLDGAPVASATEQQGRRAMVRLARPLVVAAGSGVRVGLRW